MVNGDVKMTSGETYLVELIKTLREDMQDIKRQLSVIDERQRELSEELTAFKTEADTKSKIYGAIGGMIITVIGWVITLLVKWKP